jgi:hypothetical protein
MRPTAIALAVLIGAFVAGQARAYPPDPCKHLHGRTLERCREHQRREHPVHAYNEPNHPRNQGWQHDHDHK